MPEQNIDHPDAAAIQHKEDRDRQETSERPDNDPTEYLPVMRHHLHETLWALNVALGNAQAVDLAESYRQGLTMPKESPLARQLERSHLILSQYLGLLDDGEEDENGESIPEDQ